MKEFRVALRNAGNIDPHSLESYVAAGGYQALDMARAMNPETLIGEIERSGRLRGRGGAGFNTGSKWKGAFKTPADQKYIVCNADEGEPGTYKDRAILENDPHTVLEGMAIGAYAIGASEAIIYCRAEYPHVAGLLRDAIAQAKEKLMPVSFSVCVGAGAYICGEETALLNSLEGLRGEPRLKPPYPTVAGLNGMPTVINNVETFASIPVIVEKGAWWYSSIGSVEYTGTKIFTLSGDVVNRGYFEVPGNTLIRELIYDFGGGVADGRQLKAVQVGGNSGAFITPEQLDTPFNLDALAEIGASIGSGSLFVLDDTRDMSEIALQTTRFFRDESCGKCTACREGVRRMSEYLERFQNCCAQEEDIGRILSLGEYMKAASFCPLGQSVPVPVLSAINYFRSDFEQRIEAKEVALYVTC